MFRQRRKFLHRLAFFLELQPRRDARFGLAVKRLRHRRRSAHLAQQQHLNLKFAALVFDQQHVAHAHLARRLGLDAVHVNAPQVAGLLSQRPRLEEAGGP